MNDKNQTKTDGLYCQSTSKKDLVDWIGPEKIPVIFGAVVGTAGRVIGAPWITLVPVVAHFFDRKKSERPSGNLGMMTRYFLGTVLIYADRIYSTAQDYLPLIEENFKGINL